MKPHVTHPVRPKLPNGAPRYAPIYAAICAGALSRLLWAAVALLVLWSAVYWAMS